MDNHNNTKTQKEKFQLYTVYPSPKPGPASLDQQNGSANCQESRITCRPLGLQSYFISPVRSDACFADCVIASDMKLIHVVILFARQFQQRLFELLAASARE